MKSAIRKGARLVMRAATWPMRKGVRVLWKICVPVLKSKPLYPLRNRIRTAQGQIGIIKELPSRIGKLEGRYWDHVAMSRRLAALEEQVEFLLKVVATRDLPQPARPKLAQVSAVSRKSEVVTSGPN